MVKELEPIAAQVSAIAGELLHPDGLTARAAEVAARQRSPETRRTYAAVYRTFAAFVGPTASPGDLTPEIVRSYRDQLEGDGRTLATIANFEANLVDAKEGYP